MQQSLKFKSLCPLSMIDPGLQVLSPDRQSSDVSDLLPVDLEVGKLLAVTFSLLVCSVTSVFFEPVQKKHQFKGTQNVAAMRSIR